MNTPQTRTADAIRAYGNKARLARAIGYTRQAVYGWGEFLPTKVAKLVLMAAAQDGIAIIPRPARRKAA